MGEGLGSQDLHRVRGPRHRREGRHDQADHRAGQPARVPGRRAAHPDRAGENADVRPAVHAAFPGRRRGRDLRPQLVQPGRRGAGHGLLHAGGDRAGPGACSRLGKDWLEVSPEEQTRRRESRINDPRKVWKLSPMDLRSYSRWYDYSRARDAMFAATDSAWGPWYIADADDKKRARLNIISHLLGQVPYKPLAHRDIKLPKRRPPGGPPQPAPP